MLLARFCSTLLTHSCPNRASSAGLLCATNPCPQKSLAEWASRHSRVGRLAERTDLFAVCKHCIVSWQWSPNLLPDRFGQCRKMRSSLSFPPTCVQWSGPTFVSLCYLLAAWGLPQSRTSPGLQALQRCIFEHFVAKWEKLRTTEKVFFNKAFNWKDSPLCWEYGLLMFLIPRCALCGCETIEELKVVIFYALTWQKNK